MNKKIIVFGSFLAVFLMLMVPAVNAIEYNQVENNPREKINPINEQLKTKNIISSLKSVDIQKLRYIIRRINNNPVSLCSSCGKNLLMRPKCKFLLEQFYSLTWLIIILEKFRAIPHIILLILGIHLLAVVHKARQIYCLWAF